MPRVAAQGHQVVAVEPTGALREYGITHHPSPLIQWVNDALPRLALVAARKHEFSLVMLTAVWMHLDENERRDAMPVIAALLAPNGVLSMAIRHGVVPPGRIMFAVSAKETVALAEAQGLRCVLNVHASQGSPQIEAESPVAHSIQARSSGVKPQKSARAYSSFVAHGEPNGSIRFTCGSSTGSLF
jgi:hypothetical protein